MLNVYLLNCRDIGNLIENFSEVKLDNYFYDWLKYLFKTYKNTAYFKLVSFTNYLADQFFLHVMW